MSDLPPTQSATVWLSVLALAVGYTALCIAAGPFVPLMLLVLMLILTAAS